ncbi:MAG TPA: hypothetical protein VFT94_01920 [Gaiellaceae bacterium]|nr:hypothetical protein [Gaiellaceae bacterium]
MHRPGPGHRRGHRAPLTRWLLVRGRGDRPLERHVRPEEIVAHASSKRPSLQPGEAAILYASVWQAIFALVQVAGVPEHDPERTRWAWRFPIRPLLVVRDLDRAPAVEEAGIFPQSLWRHSYIRLSEEQFETARALIERASRGTSRPGRSK